MSHQHTAVPSTTLLHVHKTTETVDAIELSPPHPPREETPEYMAAHNFLVNVKKQPCEVCGVTIDTVQPPDTLETHHSPIERSLMDACDPLKVHRDYPQVYDQATLQQFVDSPANLRVLCSTHHRSLAHGIHHLTVADYLIQRYLRDGYIVAATPQNAAAAIAIDDAIERAAGMEPLEPLKPVMSAVVEPSVVPVEPTAGA